MCSSSTCEFSAATQIESKNTEIPTDFDTDITLHSMETNDLISINTIENTPSSDTIRTPFSASFLPTSQNLVIPAGGNTNNKGNKMMIIIVIVVVIIATIIASVVVIVVLKLRKNRNLKLSETSDHKSTVQDVTIEQVQDNSDRDLNFWL